MLEGITHPYGCRASASRCDCTIPNARRHWLPRSAIECTTSDSTDAEPVYMKATSLDASTTAFVAIAVCTARCPTRLDCAPQEFRTRSLPNQYYLGMANQTSVSSFGTLPKTGSQGRSRSDARGPPETRCPTATKNLVALSSVPYIRRQSGTRDRLKASDGKGIEGLGMEIRHRGSRHRHQ
jgi:hypothetical protein